MRALRRQSGFSLLLYVLMLMAMGGLLAEGYLHAARQDAETERESHDRRVLEQAKAALLQYAYNYPVYQGKGPGRLPCADTDNDGQSNTDAVACVSIGRFPWDEIYLKTGDLRDSSGERLWYAVSGTFATNVLNNSPYVPASAKHAGGKRFINSGATGTITIKDQSGQVIYDGAVDGVAAVIIAPGATIDRNGTPQDRSISNADDPDDTVADTDPGIVDPVNYLDLNGSQDNATLTHLDSDDGFQLGPVYNSQNELVINDRIMVVTAEEVVAMAQKSVLQTYKQALREYQRALWAASSADYRFPWLDDYTTTTLDDHEAEAGTVLGRVPSLFVPYFEPSGNSFSSPLLTRVRYLGYDTPGFELSTSLDSRFLASEDLEVTPQANESFVTVRYYWDEQSSPDGWELCPPVTGTVQDCNQSASNPGTPDNSVVPNEVATRVIEVTYQWNVTAATPVSWNTRTALPIGHEPPSNSTHAAVFAEYLDAQAALDISYRYDSYYLNSFDVVDSGSFTLYQLGFRFYPELPRWTLPENDDWHDSVMMAFSSGFQPGTPTPAGCTPNNGDVLDDPDECLLILNRVDSNRWAGLLLLAGEHDLVDEASDGYQNDLADIFEGENAQIPPYTVFDARATPSTGNAPDQLLPLDLN